MLNCKVCDAVVPIRRNCYQRICEACQKFFRRYGGRCVELLCTSGTDDCPIDSSNRRVCLRCRFKKCIAAGMRSKYVTADMVSSLRQSDDYSYSVEFYSSSNSNPSMPYSPVTITLVQDPEIYDRMAAESLLQTSVRSFPTLLGMETMPFKGARPPVLCMEDFMVRIAEHVCEGFRVSLSYGEYFFDEQGLPSTKLGLLEDGLFLGQILRLFTALPSYGSNVIVGCDKSVAIPLMEEQFPEFIECVNMEYELVALLSEWNPPFIICALLFSLMLFNEKALADETLAKIRRNLLVTFDMSVSQLSNGNQDQLWKIKSLCERIFRISSWCAAVSRTNIQSVANRVPAASPLLSVMNFYRS